MGDVSDTLGPKFSRLGASSSVGVEKENKNSERGLLQLNSSPCERMVALLAS